MATQIDPPIEVQFKGKQKSQKFNTLDKIIAWADKEIAFWTDIQSKMGDLSHLQDTIQKQINVPNTLKTTAINAQPHASDINLGGQRSNIESHFRHYIKGGHNGFNLLLLDSVETGIVKSLIKISPNTANVALATFQNHTSLRIPSAINQLAPSFRDGLFGFIEAWLSIRPENIYSDSAKQALSHLHNDFNDILAKSEEELDSFSTKSEEELDSFSTKSQQTLATEVEQQDSQEKAFNELLKNSSENLEALENQFREKLRLLAPVQYWEKKQKMHLIASGGFGLLFIGTIGWVVYGLFENIEALSPLLEVQPGVFPLKSIVLFGAPAFLLIWILRIFSRNLLTNINLFNDSRERVAMINTFLALMEDPDKVKEDDRILILHALFRPSGSHGTDDAVPPNWFDIFMQRINKSHN